jgi:cytochrome c-type biogenesis protein
MEKMEATTLSSVMASLVRRTPVALLVGLALLVGVALLIVSRGTSGPSPSSSPVAAAAGCASASLGCGVADGDAADDEPSPPVEGPALIEMMSESCPVCSRVAPRVAQVEQECDRGSVRHVHRIDIDTPRGQAIAHRYGVHMIPTFVTVDAAGAEVERRVGDQSTEEVARLLSDVSGRRCASGALPDAARPSDAPRPPTDG